MRGYGREQWQKYHPGACKYPNEMGTHWMGGADRKFAFTIKHDNIVCGKVTFIHGCRGDPKIFVTIKIEILPLKEKSIFVRTSSS